MKSLESQNIPYGSVIPVRTVLFIKFKEELTAFQLDLMADNELNGAGIFVASKCSFATLLIIFTRKTVSAVIIESVTPFCRLSTLPNVG